MNLHEAALLMRWEVLAGLFLLLLPVGVFFIVSLRRAVRRKTAQLQSIFDHMQEVLYRADASGRILMITPSVTALSGYTPQEVRSRHVKDFYVDEGERNELLRLYEMVGYVHDYPIRFRHKNGSTVWVSVNSHVYFDAKGRVAGVEGTLRDIGPLKQAEGRLQTLALAVENSPAGIIITDHEANIIHANPAFEQISGYRFAEAFGMNAGFQKSGLTPDAVYREMWEVVSSGETWRGEFLNRRKNGELYCQSSAIAPVKNEHGVIIHYVAVQEDISERKRIAGELEQARHQADEANAAKSRFLAAASHDLRQPLQAMRLYLDVLAARLDDPEQQRIVAKLQAAHSDVGGLLDRLLDLSQLDSGKVQPKFEAFDLGRMLRDLHEQYHALTESAGLDWRLHSLPDPLWVASDAVFVKEILSNLISNAIRYTQQGGILLCARRRQGSIHIEVWDTGPGIEQERQADVFREFVQLGNPERDRRKGVGLGLSIVSRMCRLLGSRVVLRSRPGRGSVFSFDLPRVEKPELDAMAQPTAVGRWDFGGRLVFIIDDDPQLRDSLAMTLRLWHCKVQTFAGLEGALEAMEKAGMAPEAIIADFRLRNNASGVDAIRAVQSLAGSPVPALLLTGDTEESRMQEASSAGFPILHKPVPAQRLGVFLERNFFR